ncbi:tetratricopeptide repeat protein [bacterium]|nr:tetratricopeptide repeat protein [bacterium]
MKSAVKRIIMGCLVISSLSGICFANDLTDDYFDIAQNYYKEGNKEKSFEYINQILEIEPNNVQALGFKIKLTPPTFSKTLPDIEKPLIFDIPYVSTGNSASDTYYKQGFNCYKAKDYMLAEESLKSAIKENPNNFRAYNTLGLVYWAQNKLNEAKNAFEKSNEINKTFTIPLDNLAQIYKQTGETEKSYATLLKSQNLNSNDYCAYLLLGDYYKSAGDYNNALKNYREVIKINPKYNIAYLKIANVKSDNLDFTGSNATLKYYLGKNPNDDYAYYLMAKNYVYMNDYSKAKESIYKAISMSNCREYRVELGKINYQNEDIQDALDAFTSAVNLNTSSEVYNYIGMCYYNLHDFNKAIANINKAISMPDTRVLYYYNLAQVYYTLKDNTNYTRYMSFVKNYQPSSCQDYIDLGGILLDADSKNSAILVLNQGIEKYPKVKELYLEKLKIYDLTNDLQGIGQTKLEMENAFK